MRIEPAVSLAGHIAVPGDKSVSHRAVLLGAVGEGETLVRDSAARRTRRPRSQRCARSA